MPPLWVVLLPQSPRNPGRTDRRTSAGEVSCSCRVEPIPRSVSAAARAAAGRITADAERFIEEVRRDDHDLASYLRIEERELEDR